MSEQAETTEQPTEQPTETVTTAEPVDIPESISMADIETAAGKIGWHPDGGTKTAWEFIQNGRYGKANEELTEQVAALKTEQQSMYSLMAESVNRQSQNEYVAQRQTVDEQINAAIESGDVALTRELMAKAPAPPQPVQQPDTDAEYLQKWRGENAWFDENAEMKSDFAGFYEAEKNMSGLRPAETMVPIVMKRMEKAWPEKFKPATNPNADREPGVETGGKQVQNKAKGLRRSDLTEEEGRHLQQFIDSGADEKMLLKSIEDARVLRNG